MNECLHVGIPAVERIENEATHKQTGAPKYSVASKLAHLHKGQHSY